MLVEVRTADGPVVEGGGNTKPAASARYLAAWVDGEPVGQICHYQSPYTKLWHTEHLYVREDMRAWGLSRVLSECNCHHALDYAEGMYSRVLKRPGVTIEIYTKYSASILSPPSTVLHDGPNSLHVYRDIRPLAERIAKGEVQRITFPHRRGLPDRELCR
jgi:hypothetical protein